jgi:Tfp pilus assembly protein PilX
MSFVTRRIVTAKSSGEGRTKTKRRREGGIALFTTLLLLSLVSLLGLAMVLSVNSDMMINGYYGNYRSSFYAADSGLSIARQAIANQFTASVNMTPCTGWETNAASGCTSPPVSTTAPGTVLSSVTSTYGSGYSNVNSSGSWPGSFKIINSAGCTNSLVLAPGYPTTTQNAQLQNNAYTYRFNYTLCATGRAQSLQQVLVKESGSMVLNVQAQTFTTQQAQVSFASFGIFIDQFNQCKGPLVPGTMTGPVFTNGSWNFGTGGNYIYTDPVGQHNANASYWFGGTCKQSPTNSYTYNGQTIKPTFQSGFNMNQPVVDLPANDFSQQWAVMDGKGCGEKGTTCGTDVPPAPSHSDMNKALMDVKKNAYPSSGASSGVFLPYCTTSCPTGVSPYTVNGGGILVEGDAAVTLNVGKDGSNNPTQVFTITQGSTTTTITTNITANTTTVVSGGNSVSLTGVPQNLSTTTASPATMLYVDGKITGLSGPGQGKAGIQDYSQITVAAASDINITGDLIYAHPPVTLNAADTLIANQYDSGGKQIAGDFNSVLGIFTSKGNINLSSPYSNGNLETDASMAAINSDSSWCNSNSKCGFGTPSDNINVWTILGGRIESFAHSVSISQGNTYFDRRFTARAGFAPPWFPSTTIPLVDITNAAPPQVNANPPQRLSWVTYPQ